MTAGSYQLLTCLREMYKIYSYSERLNRIERCNLQLFVLLQKLNLCILIYIVSNSADSCVNYFISFTAFFCLCCANYVLTEWILKSVSSTEYKWLNKYLNNLHQQAAFGRKMCVFDKQRKNNERLDWEQNSTVCFHFKQTFSLRCLLFSNNTKYVLNPLQVFMVKNYYACY